MQKRGQITIFIIVGIALLIGIAIFFYISITKTRGTTKPEAESTIGLTYKGEQEIKNYVQHCIEEITLDALEVMRLQAGYINIPKGIRTLNISDKEGKEVIIKNYRKQVDINKNNKPNEVPYWLTKEQFQIPPLYYMEAELSDYIKENVNRCIGNFTEFIDTGFEIKRGELNVSAMLVNSVIIDIKLPITAKKETTVFKIEEFRYIVPINMKLIHDLADYVTSYESKNTFLEQFTKQLISDYSGIDENKFPPFSKPDTNFNCDSVTWSKLSVKERLKSNFNINYHYLKINDTNFTIQKRRNEIEGGVFKGMVYDIFNYSLSTVKINISYEPYWDFMDYDITPSHGGKIEPEKTVGIGIPYLARFCVFKYTSKYYLQYPVLVEITDDKSAEIEPTHKIYKADKGYKFQFPIWVYLCGNQERGCNSFTNITSLGTGYQSYFCDYKQRLNNQTILSIKNIVTGTPLPNVSAYYFCGSSDNDCFIGSTNNNGVLNESFPFCVNGIVYLEKPNYKGIADTLTVQLHNKQELNYSLEPVVRLNFSAKLVNLTRFIESYNITDGFKKPCGNKSPDKLLEESFIDLGSDDKAEISLSGEKSITLNYPSSMGAAGKTFDYLELNSGLYNLESLYKSKVKIMPSVYCEENRCFNFSWDKISNDTPYEGEMELGRMNITFLLTHEELNNKKDMTFLMFAEHFSSQDLEVKDFDMPILKDNWEISKEITFDDDCNETTFMVTKNVTIHPLDYSPFVMPLIR